MTRGQSAGGGLPLMALLLSACATAGSAWMDEPMTQDDELGTMSEPPGEEGGAALAYPAQPRRRVLGAPAQREVGDAVDPAQLKGDVLGTFRNTYYDFPNEADYKSKQKVGLKDGRCRLIKEVPKDFHDTVCVQGSGMLSTGQTVSFHKRDCECAATCPRTDQRICFDALSADQFPWGRGATGGPITPLLTIATDPGVIRTGTSVYIPEYEGMPTEHDGSGRHDGCFIAQDRGLKVKSKHVDVFTGHESITRLWNRLVPSNAGVTIVVNSPSCSRAGAQKLPPPSDDDD